MGCQELVGAIERLATSLAQGGGGQGSGCCAPSVGQLTGVAGAVSALPPSAILPQPPLSVDTGGSPPEGFETWQAYNLYKCKAAHQIWTAVYRFADTCMLMGGLALVSNVAAEGLLAYVALFGAVLTPVTIVAVMGILLTISLYSIFGLSELGQFKTWWETNKTAIVCSLYLSNDAATALQAISNFIADGVQAIEWTGLLAPLAPELSVAVGALMSQIESNNLVNILFKLVTDVAIPDGTCDCPGGPQTTAFHFDTDAEGFSFSTLAQSPNTSVGQWNDNVVGRDDAVMNESPGRLWGLITLNDAGVGGCIGEWTKAFGSEGPVMHTGDLLHVDCIAGAAGLTLTIGVYAEGGVLATSVQSIPITHWAQRTLVIPESMNNLRMTYVYVVQTPEPYNAGVWETGIDRVYLEAA